MLNFKLDNEDLLKHIRSVENDPLVNLNILQRKSKPDTLVRDLINSHKAKKAQKSIDNWTHHDHRSNLFNIVVTNKNFQRAIVFLDTFIKVIKDRGHRFEINQSKTFVIIGSEKLEIRLWEKSRVDNSQKKSKYDSREFVPTGLLSIQYFDIWMRKEWSDTAYTKIEDKLSKIVGSIEYIAEVKAKERKERELYWEAERIESARKQEQKQREENELKCFEKLLTDSDKWDKAQKLRKYINYIESKEIKIESEFESVSEWVAWAKKKANWLDPLVNENDEILDS